MGIPDDVAVDVGDRVGKLIQANILKLDPVYDKVGVIKISCSIKITKAGKTARVKVDLKSKLDEFSDKSEGLVSQPQQKFDGM